MARKPLVALVGRPNVGKSTLFNRLVGQRMAVVDDIPGTTRDRLQSEFEWRGMMFMVIDTGGIEVYQPKGSRDISPLAEGSADFVPQIKAQALMAINDADVIVMVADAVHGITAADEEVAEILRRTEKPVIVAANKVDDMRRVNDSFEFFGLGVGEVYPISAIHGLGVGDLLDAIYRAVEGTDLVLLGDEEEQQLRIAIVGRPNVGKSSLVNRLLGEDRVIVSPIAGTTRDAIDSEITYHGEKITLIDTAGIRRRGRIEPGVEKYSVLRSMKAIERADVVLLLIDGVEGVTDQDQHIAGYILEAGKSVIVIVNKWDAVEKDSATLHEYEKTLRYKFDFLPDSPILFISALTGQRIHQVLETAVRVWEGRHFRIPTADLNRIIRDSMLVHTPPIRGTRRLKILYASQVAVNPPVILFHVNDPRLVHFTYKRFLENQIRKVYPFEGTPMRMSFRPNDGGLKD
ncbi:ribosome biogenesis GTPase Der [Anaerolineae bacterium CFX9]|nr:ribosome biogenesis GTPase Der [Kamptonema cortianum]MDL1901465.1 ribosome biogenesis GTPase Der [Anaerolineae bacterium CFX9]